MKQNNVADFNCFKSSIFTEIHQHRWRLGLRPSDPAEEFGDERREVKISSIFNKLKKAQEKKLNI